MADDREKDGGGPDETWVKRLTAGKSETPEGVKIYVGLLRESPSDSGIYLVYLGLDLRSCLHVEKIDVLQWEDLPQDKSPFGTLGGTRIYVRRGAKIKVVTTSTTTLEVGTDDEFDLDIRLGARRGLAAPAAENLTIPDTGCGAACDALPPFTVILETHFPCVDTQGLCGLTQATCVCVPTQGGQTCGVNCQTITQSLTCMTHCVTCNTGGTWATCQTCRTNCVALNTYNAQCGQVAFGPWWNTRPFTACNHNTCVC